MKTASSALSAHIAQNVTTLATCWNITRTDGTVFYFTDHNHSLTVSTHVYKSTTGYRRSPISNDVSMAVDNLDVVAVLNDSDIAEADLIGGLFDFAEIRVFLVNYADLSQGTIAMRRGWIGEVTPQPTGVFAAELRGMTQALSRRIGELYSPECRADLGDTRCKVPIKPSGLTRPTAYSSGDYVRVLASAAGVIGSVFLMHGDGTADDKSRLAQAASTGSAVSISSDVFKFGSGSLKFAGTAGIPPTNAAAYDDNDVFAFASGAWTIEGFVNFTSLTDTQQTMICQWHDTIGERGWLVYRNGSNISLDWAPLGAAKHTVNGSTTWSTSTWTHVAVARDSSHNMRMFVSGVQKGTTDTMFDEGVWHSSGQPLRLGQKGAAADGWPLSGYLDEWRVVVGTALYTSTFSPPSAAFSDLVDYYASTQTVQFNDTVFQCTTAGTTAGGAQPTYNFGIGSTTTDGTAVFTAQEAFMRAATVSTVTDRSIFRIAVTEARASEAWFEGGVARFESGGNKNIAREIKYWNSSGGQIETFLAFPFAINAGDALTVYPGCDKRLATCLSRFNNVVNFRGEPFVPGADSFTKYPDAS